MLSKTEKKLMDLLGFAMKAGQLLTGADAVMRAAKKGQVHMVFLASDTAVHTDKKVRALISALEIPLNGHFDREVLSAAIGKNNRAVIGVTDQGFSKRLSALSEQLEVELCQN